MVDRVDSLPPEKKKRDVTSEYVKLYNDIIIMCGSPLIQNSHSYEQNLN